MEQPRVLTEPLTQDEEVDFLVCVAEAELAGELSHEEAHHMIDREYELLLGEGDV